MNNRIYLRAGTPYAQAGVTGLIERTKEDDGWFKVGYPQNRLTDLEIAAAFAKL